MEDINILYKPELELHLNELNFILFENNYFNYLNNSILYKNKIVDFVNQNISDFPAINAPSELKKFGSKYIFYKLNRLTTWYIFFENKNNNYLITHILNSHIEETKWLLIKPPEQL